MYMYIYLYCIKLVYMYMYMYMLYTSPTKYMNVNFACTFPCIVNSVRSDINFSTSEIRWLLTCVFDHKVCLFKQYMYMYVHLFLPPSCLYNAHKELINCYKSVILPPFVCNIHIHLHVCKTAYAPPFIWSPLTTSLWIMKIFFVCSFHKPVHTDIFL